MFGRIHERHGFDVLPDRHLSSQAVGDGLPINARQRMFIARFHHTPPILSEVGWHPEVVTSSVIGVGLTVLAGDAPYRKEYDDHGLWVRPVEMFLGPVEVAGEPMPRFQYVGPE